ncbi:3-hydroxyacyl-ACP dehydratase FabZ family protein [Nocardia sp. NPDC088792]|uniref:3-hydroxyacyl-ACP dehydratase FabZ family protein n=1 Tax=Nocardia sp. NPDC088792 TaxID=3364332 RepID=UPI0038277389
MTASTTYDTAALLNLLPHRPPILMIDRLDVAEDGETARGYKSIDAGEPCFQQTEATGSRAYPRALIVESLGQAAAALWLHREAESAESAGTLYFAKAEGVTFLRDVFPGDDLVHEIRFDRSIRGTAFMSGRTLLNGEQIAVVESIIAAAR